MKELLRTRTHPKVLFKPLLIQIFLVFLHAIIFKFVTVDIQWLEPALHGILLLVAIWYFVTPLLQWWNNVFIVTEDRVRNEWGVLYKHSREVRLKNIASVSEERGIIDRLFGAGTLNFYDASAYAQPETSGAWNKKNRHAGIRFTDIPRIKTVKALIENARMVAEGKV